MFMSQHLVQVMEPHLSQPASCPNRSHGCLSLFLATIRSHYKLSGLKWQACRLEVQHESRWAKTKVLAELCSFCRLQERSLISSDFWKLPAFLACGFFLFQSQKHSIFRSLDSSFLPTTSSTSKGPWDGHWAHQDIPGEWNVLDLSQGQLISNANSIHNFNSLLLNQVVYSQVLRIRTGTSLEGPSFCLRHL